MTRSLSSLGSVQSTEHLLHPEVATIESPAGVKSTSGFAKARLEQELVQPAGRASSKPRWARHYVQILVASDAVCALAAITVAWVLRSAGWPDARISLYLAISGLLVVGWLICMNAVGGYDLRVVATGTQETRLTIRSALVLGGAMATVAYLSHILVARTFLGVVVVLGALLQVIARYLIRRGVHSRRARGEWTRTIVAVGTTESVRYLIETTARHWHTGLRVVGACVEDAEVGTELAPGVAVLGPVTRAATVAEHIDAQIVAVAGGGLGPRSIRELGWALEGTGRHMVMAPGLSEVAGPRIHVRPVEGLPLVWVDQPQFTGVARLAKRAMDIAGAAVLLVIGAPFLLLIGMLVRLTSSGPALYRSVRTGSDGKLVNVVKYRSMYSDSDDLRVGLLQANESEGGVLFKLRVDPRVTPIGRFLRKFSLDELPQLINVLHGTMSLVGPRPPLPDEVAKYQDHDHRRMLVKPGMTGLWQVSGRSDLCWEESVRLDLFYVENWSLGLDLAIILRTVWAVLGGRGAY